MSGTAAHPDRWTRWHLERWLAAERNDRAFMLNPDSNGCCVLLDLGPRWPHERFPCFCSHRALPDAIVCGKHAPLWWAVMYPPSIVLANTPEPAA